MNAKLIEISAAKPTNCAPAEAQLLARKLGDLDRPAEFLDRALAGDDLADAGDHHARRCRRVWLDGQRDRLAGAQRLDRHSASPARADAEPADRGLVAEPVASRSIDRRSTGSVARCARRARPSSVDRSPGWARSCRLHVVEVARPRAPSIATIRSPTRKPGFARRPSPRLEHRRSPAGVHRLAEREVERGEDRDRDQEVGHRPGGDDQRALPQRLGLEGLRRARPRAARAIPRSAGSPGSCRRRTGRSRRAAAPRASSACRAGR